MWRAALAALASVLLIAGCPTGIDLPVTPTGSPLEERESSSAVESARNGLIAFTSDRDGQPKIYRMDPRSLRVARFFRFPAESPAWSPDGTKIVFISPPQYTVEWIEKDPETTPNLFIANADGSGPRRLTSFGDDPEGISRPKWSPDGTQILFNSNENLFVINADGSGQVRITAASEYDADAVWAPDGQRVAFIRQLGRWKTMRATGERPRGSSFQNDLFVINSDGTDRQNISASASLSERQPAWSPDGESIAYAATGSANYRGDIYLFNGRTHQNLTQSAVRDSEPIWASGGAEIIFISEGGLYLIDSSGHSLRKLSSDRLAANTLRWSPDSSRLIFLRGGYDAQTDMYVFSPAKRKLTRLTHNPFRDFDFSWQPWFNDQPPRLRSADVVRLIPPDGTLGGACAVDQARGDFDGDGERDVIVLATPGRFCGGDRASYRRKAILFHGRRRDVVAKLACSQMMILRMNPSAGCGVLGAVDLNGDGKHELVLDLGGSSATTNFYTLAAIEDGQLERIEVAPPGSTFHDGYQEVPSGFSVLETGGGASYPMSFHCYGATGSTGIVRQVSTSLRDSGQFNVRITSMLFDGEVLRVYRERTYQAPYRSKKVSGLVNERKVCGLPFAF